MKKQRGGFFPIFLTLIGVFGIVMLTWGNYRYAVENPCCSDFLTKWSGANKWLTEGISPYADTIQIEVEKFHNEHPPKSPSDEIYTQFFYPFYSMLFYIPVGLFEFTLARALFMSILEICIMVTVLVGLKLANWQVSIWVKVLFVLFALTWYHSVRTIEIGQLGGITALMAILGIYFIQQKQDVAAGVFLALATSNLQLVLLLIPFIFIWAFSVKRPRIIFSTLGTLAALILVSFALLDTWLSEMLQQFMEFLKTPFLGSPISIFASAMPGVSDLVNRVLTIVLILYLFIEWALAWGKKGHWFLWTASLTMVISNLTAFRAVQSNYMILLPVLFVIFRVWVQRWGMTGRYLVIISIIVLSIGLWGLFFLANVGMLTQTIIYLPLPIMSILGLWWVRWWAIRPPKLLLQDFASRFGGD